MTECTERSEGREGMPTEDSGVTSPTYDAVIAGGGLSGLSLLGHLAVSGWRDRRVLLIDDDTRPAATCWGFWSDRDGLLDPASSRAYSSIRVNAAGIDRTVPLGRYRYRLVRRADLLKAVTALVAARPRFVLRTGRVEAVRDHGDRAEVTVDGEAIGCRWAFDSVPARPAGPDPTGHARMAFTGWEVSCPSPVFDPRTPTMFDFRGGCGDASFVYVLPDGPRRALVEATEFVARGRRPTPGRARAAAVAAYLRDVIGATGYETLRTESAVLPLRPDAGPRRTGRVLTIGVRGGLVKASTGYAYTRIQRDCEAIARSLTRHDHPFDLPPPSRRHRLLDAVLLEAIRRDPAQLEVAFAHLFAANPAERVLGFLDERTGLTDELRLIASLPPAPYLRAAARHCVGSSARRRAGTATPGRWAMTGGTAGSDGDGVQRRTVGP
jgi:lycopene beta-cyclase